MEACIGYMPRPPLKTNQPASHPPNAGLCLVYPPLPIQEFRAGNKSPTGSYHVRIEGKKCESLYQACVKYPQLYALEPLFQGSPSAKEVKVVNSWAADCWLQEFSSHKIQHTRVINTQYRLSDYKKA